MSGEDFDHKHKRMGCIEVICGSMFSGKTEELLRRVKRARIAKLKVELFKHAVDQRYHPGHVVSHDENSLVSTVITTSGELLAAPDADIIAIDEAQFFDRDLPLVCRKLADQGKRVIVAGLDMDFRGQPFGPMPDLLATAEFVTKVHAICMVCGELAAYSHRLSPGGNLVMIGEKDHYQALCRRHYNEVTVALQ